MSQGHEKCKFGCTLLFLQDGVCCSPHIELIITLKTLGIIL